MLKATAVEVRLTAADVEEALLDRAPENVEDLSVHLGEGVITVRHKVSSERLPFAVPVELQFRLHDVADNLVRLDVTWANLPLLPGFLKELVLKKAFEPLPGRYADGQFTVDVMELLQDQPVSFRLSAIEVRPDHVKVTVSDMVLLRVEPDIEVEPVSGALIPVPSAEEAQIPEHGDYYHKLRQKMSRFAAQRAPRWTQPVVPWVLAVPDFFATMVRLARDERVPTPTKLLAGAVVAYFVMPVDILPDLIPFVGQVDDVAVALFAIEKIAAGVDERVLQEAWPGDGRVLEVAKTGVDRFTKLLPAGVLTKIRDFIRRKS